MYTNDSFLLFCCGSLLLVRISVLVMFVQIIITMKVKTMKVKTRIMLFAKALHSYSSYIKSACIVGILCLKRGKKNNGKNQLPNYE